MTGIWRLWEMPEADAGHTRRLGRTRCFLKNINCLLLPLAFYHGVLGHKQPMLLNLVRLVLFLSSCKNERKTAFFLTIQWHQCFSLELKEQRSILIILCGLNPIILKTNWGKVFHSWIVSYSSYHWQDICLIIAVLGHASVPGICRSISMVVTLPGCCSP